MDEESNSFYFKSYLYSKLVLLFFFSFTLIIPQSYFRLSLPVTSRKHFSMMICLILSMEQLSALMLKGPHKVSSCKSLYGLIWFGAFTMANEKFGMNKSRPDDSIFYMMVLFCWLYIWMILRSLGVN